jgi:tetratricopeptide (TPR) repeat protein
MPRLPALVLWLALPALLPADSCPPEEINKLEKNTPTARDLSAAGTGLAQRRLYACAVLAFEKALSIDPLYTNARFNLGLAFLNSGNTERAIIEWMVVLETKPDLFVLRHSY